MENVNTADILDELENKLKVERIAKILIEFKYKAIVDWINRMDRKAFENRQEYNDRGDKDIDDCAIKILEVANNGTS